METFKSCQGFVLCHCRLTKFCEFWTWPASHLDNVLIILCCSGSTLSVSASIHSTLSAGTLTDLENFAASNLNIQKKGLFRKKMSLKDVLSWTAESIRWVGGWREKDRRLVARGTKVSDASAQRHCLLPTGKFFCVTNLTARLIILQISTRINKISKIFSANLWPLWTRKTWRRRRSLCSSWSRSICRIEKPRYERMIFVFFYQPAPGGDDDKLCGARHRRCRLRQRSTQGWGDQNISDIITMLAKPIK